MTDCQSSSGTYMLDRDVPCRGVCLRTLSWYTNYTLSSWGSAAMGLWVQGCVRFSSSWAESSLALENGLATRMDILSCSSGVRTVIGDGSLRDGGTSCASPTFAHRALSIAGTRCITGIDTDRDRGAVFGMHDPGLRHMARPTTNDTAREPHQPSHRMSLYRHRGPYQLQGSLTGMGLAQYLP